MATAEGAGACDGGQLGRDGGGRHGKWSASLNANPNDEPTHPLPQS